MTIASGAKARLSYVKETTQGTTPGSPTMLTLRCREKMINLSQGLLENDEMRADRLEGNARQGFRSVVGNPTFNLGLTDYDDMIYGALGGVWTAINASGTPQFGATAPNIITRSLGSFVTDLYKVGMIVLTTGFSAGNNNGYFKIASVSATQLTMVEQTITTEGAAAGRSCNVAGKIITPSTDFVTWSIERAWTDLLKYQVFTGVTINTLDLSFTPESLIQCSLGLVGMSSAAISGTSLGSPTAAGSSDPFSSFDGSIIEGTTPALNAVLTGFSFNIDNGRTTSPVCFSKTSPAVYDGPCKISGKADFLLDSETTYNKLVSDTVTGLYVKMASGTDFHNIGFPACRLYGSDGITGPITGPCVVSLNFKPTISSAAGTTMFWQRSNS